VLTLQRSVGNAAVARLLTAGRPARPLLQRVLEIQPSIAKIERYPALVAMFLDAMRSVDPDLWSLMQGPHVVLRFKAEKIKEYASTMVLVEETILPEPKPKPKAGFATAGQQNRKEKEKEKAPKPEIKQTELIGRLRDAIDREQALDPSWKVVVEVTLNSDRKRRTGPQTGGALLETLAHEMYAHAARSAKYIQTALRLKLGQTLRPTEKRDVAKHAESRSYRNDTNVEHRSLATGEDQELEARLAKTRQYLAQHHPGEPLAEEFALELDQDRRDRDADFKTGSVYVGGAVFQPTDVDQIVAAGREAMRAFSRAKRMGSTLERKLVAAYDDLQLREDKKTKKRRRTITDAELRRFVEPLELRFLWLHEQLNAATSLIQLYGWSEDHALRLIEDKQLRDGRMVSAEARSENEPMEPGMRLAYL
jgi:hypothetical protein